MLNHSRVLASTALVPAFPTPAIFTGGRKLPSFYANTLTNLIPDLYAGMDVVSRELVGFLPAVTRNQSAERAAVGEAVRGFITPAITGTNVTPAMAIPEPTDRTLTNKTLTISKSRAFEFGFVGEEQKGLNNGPGYLSVQADLFAQALRGLVNEIENDIAVESITASRAYGTGAVTPFASDTAASANIKKILDDNGAPSSQRALVIDTTAGAKLRTLLGINADRAAQDQMTMEQGSLINLDGFVISESAAVQSHTKGTGASATTDNAGYAVGATVITLASAGTGTVVVGDVVTFAGDANQYVVTAGDTDVSNGGTITIQEPGLREAIPASTTNITIIASSTKNVGFTRSAIHLALRAPALPQEGDIAADRMTITDPRSGMSFEIAVYPGYRKVRFEVVAAWGVLAFKPEHIALLLG